MLTRIVSTFAAVVVFITTYALVLPAITMESQADCGIPAHQHDDSCYELICGQIEDPGHHHTDACYTTLTSLICTEQEHQHDDACYDEEGNLICELPEHTHEDACYEETRELTCELEESEGHQHIDACYERVLTCGLEAHTHSAACYTHVSDDTAGGSGASAEDYAVVAATTEAAGEHVSMPANDGDNSGDAVSAADTSDIDGSDTIAVDAADTGLSGLPAEEDAYIPELEALFFDQILTQKTGIYYFHPEEGETIPDNTADITEWTRVKDDTDLAPADMLRVYLRYTIPAGSLNSTNPVARYRLPANLHLTDQQMEEINVNVNGIAGQYINLDTLEILDPDQYNQYLGIEAVEGTRTPADNIVEYFDKHPDMNRQEYISATVRAEDVYDTEGLYGEKDAYLGQDLIFTFTPYTIQKNQHEYDADGQPTKAGEKVDGWLCLDIHTDQIDWGEPVVTTETVTTPEEEAPDIDADTEDATGSTPVSKTMIEQKESAAEIIFAAEDKSLKIDKISTNIRMIERTEITSEDEDADKDQDGENETTVENADEDAENPDQISPDGKSEEEDSDGTDDASADSDPAIEINAENYPAVSFEDSIIVRAGTLSTDNESASKDIPEETTIAVSVSADVETFPRGTTMVLGAVDDMDTVASAVEGAVEGQTRGFHAVDISFIDPDGKEIEPLKPIKVSMTSEAIKQAVEDSSTVPVVVHVESSADPVADDLASTDLTETDTAANKVNPTVDVTDPASEATATIVESNETTSAENSASKKDTADTLSFDAGSFSVYAIVYTVDFHWEVDGKTYDFSIPGGGFVSLEHLVEVLGIAKDNANIEYGTENAEIDAENADDFVGKLPGIDAIGENGTTYEEAPILNEGEVSEAAKKFVAEVERVEFSSPELVWVGKVDEAATVGGLKETNGLEVDYSADLTEAQIAEINAQMVGVGDWALISEHPFTSEESLTVTMKNGDQWTVRVTDNQLTGLDAINKDEAYVK